MVSRPLCLLLALLTALPACLSGSPLSGTAQAMPAPAAADVSGTGTARSVSGAAQALSSTARDKAPVRPPLPKLTRNDPGEDFMVVSIISMPFTALYAGLAVALVDTIRQRQFPPQFDQPSVDAVAGAAVLGSFTIAAISVKWSSSSPKKAPAKNRAPQTNP